MVKCRFYAAVSVLILCIQGSMYLTYHHRHGAGAGRRSVHTGVVLTPAPVGQVREHSPVAINCSLWREQVYSPQADLTLSPHTFLHLPQTEPLVILGFPFLHELDILHIKLQLLSSVVSYFVISESCYSQRGRAKPLHFNQSKHETRFQQYQSKIWHIIDCEPPVAVDDQLGWLQTDKVKSNIGLALLSQPLVHDQSVVIIGDSDEVPSLESVKWLQRQNMGVGITYEFESTMPHYIYGFQWRVRPNGYSTMTARSAQFERLFWKAKFEGIPFSQNVLPIPPSLAEGSWHCSYCLSYEDIIEKLNAANTVDGQLILGRYKWEVQTLRALKGCGVTLQGGQCQLSPMNLSAYSSQYPHLFHMPNCTAFSLPFK